MMRRILFVSLSLLSLAACGQNMREQPRYETLGEASAFENDSSARMPPEGTVSQSMAAYADTGRPDVDEALLAHGRERFDIYCAPCHGLGGYGDGMIVQRGFPTPPSFHEARLREAPADHFYDVITNGYGVMYSYASRVPPQDRWAIVAYIRALQLSQNATEQIAASQGVELP